MQASVDEARIEQAIDAIYACANPDLDWSGAADVVAGLLPHAVSDPVRRLLLGPDGAASPLPVPAAPDGTPDGTHWQGLVERLKLHVRRVWRIRLLVEELRRTRGNPVGLITAMARPAGLMTGAGELIVINQPAITLLSARQISWGSHDRAWARECRHAVRHGSGSVQLADGLEARLVRLTASGASATAMVSAYALETVVVELVEQAASAVQISLTPAERDILMHLRAGARVNQIAEARMTSVETVRQQLKILRAKTGRASLAALASLPVDAGGSPGA